MRHETTAAFAPATTPEQIDRALSYGAAVRRRKRENDFTRFREIAGSFFVRPPASDAHQRMKARNGFFVTGTAPAPDAALDALTPVPQDSRAIEVFYGSRPVQNFQRLNQERLRQEWRSVRETGAALLYTQGEDGAVSAYLYPAFTDNIRPEEDGLLLARYTDLELLTGRGVLETHWRALRAYAEVTSIDGEPSTEDHLLVAWMRFTRPLIRNGRRLQREMVTQAQNILGFSIAVALSALMISTVL